MKMRASIVDGLPSRLWKSGNLYMPFNHWPFSYLPESSTFTEHTLHFCVGDGVRTVEWDDREIARGAKPFISPDR
jgi:hypothetical protein